jgi:hypothetical protein
MGRKAQAGATASSSGFIGFSSFAAPAAVENSHRIPARSEAPLRALPPFYDGNHSEVALICKRLTKKDATTKLKALQQLQTLCGSGASDAALTAEASSNSSPLDPAAVAGLLPHWVFLYSRLVLDNDRRVREALNTTLQSVALIDRRAVAPYMRQLLGPWCMSMADSVTEVAAAAVRAFEGVFPAAKRRAVLLKEHRADVLAHFSTTLALTPESLSEPFACSTEEAAERYERVVVSCLSAVAALLRAPLTAAAATATTAAGTASAETPAAVATTVTADEQQLIGDLLCRWLTDPQPAFRRAACAVLCSCCEAHAFSDSSEQPSRLAPVVLALPLDAEPANHSAAFSALLLFMQAHPAAVAAARCEALLLRPLLKQLRAGAYLPSAGASYASLLPLLAGLPSEALEQHRPGGGAAYYGRLLEAVWSGLDAAGNNGTSLVSTAASCLCTVLQKMSILYLQGFCLCRFCEQH